MHERFPGRVIGSGAPRLSRVPVQPSDDPHADASYRDETHLLDLPREQKDCRRTRVVQGFSLAICLLALFASPALAQTRDPRNDAPVQIGPFYITPVLELTRLGVDTNVFHTDGEQRSDFTFTAGPRIDIIALPLRRFVFTGKTVTDFVYYRRFENQRGINFAMTVRGEVQRQRASFFVENSFLNTRERPNFDIDVRARRYENDVRAGLSLDIFRRVEVELAFGRFIRKYDGDDLVGARLARILNRDAVAASGSLRYALTPVTAIRVSGELRAERFPLTHARDSDSWSIVPGVEFNARAVISGSAELGYRSMRGVDKSLPVFSGPVASVDLSYKLLGSTTIGFTASRDVEFSSAVSAPYYVASGYGLSFGHQLTALLDFSIGAQRSNYSYRQVASADSSNAPVGWIDTIHIYSFGLNRRLTRTTQIGFFTLYNSRRSNGEALGGRDFEGLVAGITTGYAF